MTKRTWIAAMACALCLTAGSLQAQMFPGGINGGGLGIPGGGMPTGELIAEVPDLTVAPGTMFEVPVLVNDPTPLMGCVATLNTDPSGVQFLSGTQGEGLLAYLDANGEPPQCDIMTDQASGMGFLFFGIPYDATVYGPELLVFTAIAPATPGTYTIDYMIEAFGPLATGQATITVQDGSIDPPKEFVRGDINDDGACNIADPVMLLVHLFDGGEEPNCFDSADVDDDGVVNLADVVNLLSGVFGTGFEMDETCKEDLSDDSLGTCDRSNCQ